MKRIVPIGVILCLFAGSWGSAGCGMLEPYGRDESLEGKTQVRLIDPGAQSPNPNAHVLTGGALYPGALVYFTRQGSAGQITNFFISSADTASTSSAIQNGSYAVHGFGFTAADWSSVKCGSLASNVDLIGGTRDIDLTLTSTGCKSSAFAPDALRDTRTTTLGELLPLRIFSCRPSGFSAVTSTNEYSCAYGTGLGTLRSLRVYYRIYDTNADQTHRDLAPFETFMSPCVSATGTTLTSIDTHMPLPLGGPSQVPRTLVGIAVWDQVGCPGGQEVAWYDFPQGLSRPDLVNLFRRDGAAPAVTPGAKIFNFSDHLGLYLIGVDP